jgi:tetratricopeptide (TPR) repeat protein
VDSYLKGRFYWNKRTPESLNQALEAFTQAIARDPNYSDAYVGLADSYNLLREFSAMPGNEAYFKAFAAAKKAVELDQQSSEAHASLGFVTFCGHRQKRPLLAVLRSSPAAGVGCGNRINKGNGSEDQTSVRTVGTETPPDAAR